MKIEKLVNVLADKPTTSTKTMCREDRANGIRQMLEDLQMLAKNDGCIAAAWAFEFIDEEFNPHYVFEVDESIGQWYISAVTKDTDGVYLLKDGSVSSFIPIGGRLGYFESKSDADKFLKEWNADNE